MAAAIAFASALILAIFALPALAWDVTIAWDPNTEPKLDGYTVYFARYSPGPPYDYIGDLPLSSLPNPNYPSTEITSLEDGVEYFFALTAYDTESNESAFSNFLCIRRDGQTIVDCTPPPSSNFGTSSGSGSSGGGCFVQSAGHELDDSVQSVVPLVLFGLSILTIVFKTALLRQK
jgi:hypothetical protein